MVTRLRSLFVALVLVALGAMPVCAQTILAKGKVIDNAGKGLQGVSVLPKGEKTGTSTASDGTFSIQVSEKTILIFSLTGKKTVEQVASDKMTVTLENAEQQGTTVASMRQATSVKSTYYPLWVIDGVVYKEDPDFNVADLSSPEAKRIIAASLPGVSEGDIESFQVISDASATALYGQRALGGVISVRTRRAGQGVNSFTYQAQLTYRQIPSYRDYNIMNSQDQMALYQEMDAGKRLRPDIVGTRNQWGVYGYMYNHLYDYSPETGYLIKNTDAGRNAYLRQAEMRNTDWFKELFQNSIKHQHTVSLSTGNQKANYYASMGIEIDPGWSKYQNAQSYFFNFNANFKPLKNWSLGMQANAAYSKDHTTGDWGAQSYATNYSRTLDPNANYAYNYTSFNIKDELNHNYRDYKTADIRLQATLDWTPLPQLRLNALGSVRYQDQYSVTTRDEESNAARVYRNMDKSYIRTNNTYLYKPLDDPRALPQIVMPYGGIRTTQNVIYERFDVQGKAYYNDTFGEDHSLSAVGGIEIFDNHNMNEWHDAYGVNFELGYLSTYSPQLFTMLRNKSQQYYSIHPTVDRGVSYVGNVDYSFKDRYHATGSFRYEGTNQFGEAKHVRWIPTWNAGLSWDIDKESFFAKLRPLSSLSTSLSYGMSGTIPYVHNAMARLKTLLPFFGDASFIEPGLYIDEPANSNLTYEKMYELNWTLNFGLFNNRIGGSVTLFNRQGRDLIDQVNSQGTNGFSSGLYGNVAEMSSNGAEVSLTTQNIRTKDFSWSTSISYSHNTNKVTRLNTNPSVSNLVADAGAARQGYPLQALFSIPFYKLDNHGFPRFYYPEGGDVAADGRHITSLSGGNQISWSAYENDKIDYLRYSGTRRPTDLGGMNNNFSFKDFRLGIYIVYSFGAVQRLPRQFSSIYYDYGVLGREFNQRWQRPGDEEHTNVPVLATDNDAYNYGYLSDAYSYYNYSDVRVAKSDYIQLRDISLSYNVPQSFAQKLRLSSLALKLQASNVALLYADKRLNGALPYAYQPHSYIFTCTVGL